MPPHPRSPLLLCLLLLTLILAACGGAASSPEEVTEGYVTACDNSDPVTATQYLPPKLRELLPLVR